VKGNPEPVQKLYFHRDDVTPSAIPRVDGSKLVPLLLSMPHRSILEEAAETSRQQAKHSLAVGKLC
jgi:hypothetical protein